MAGAALPRSSQSIPALWIGIFLSSLGGPPAEAGPSIEQYEIKTLGAEPGAVEIQSQNDFSIGNPGRRVLPDGSGGIIADDNTVTRQREGLEVEMGITRFLKARLGIEFEQNRVDSPASSGTANAFEGLEFDDYGVETIWTLIPPNGDGAGVGILIEYDRPAHSNEASTLTLGPIFEWTSGPWSATLNPIVTQYFGGPLNDEGRRDHKLDFGYSAQVMYAWSEHLSLALEAYGSIERIGNTGSPDEAARLFGNFGQHRLGPIIYWTLDGDETDRGRRVETTLGFGALLGLNEETPDATMKLSLEVNF